MCGLAELLHDQGYRVSGSDLRAGPTVERLRSLGIEIAIGHDAENPACLCSMDVLGDVAWNQGHIIAAQKSTGRWAVDVDQPGDYRFALRRWPEELDLPIEAGLPDEQADRIAPFQRNQRPVRTVSPVKARLTLFGDDEIQDVDPVRKEVIFDRKVDRSGTTELEAWFTDAAGEDCGAYYVTVERRTG